MISLNNNYSRNIMNSPKFGAIPCAEYKMDNNKKVIIYELEKKDVPFVNEFRSNLGEYKKEKNIKDASRSEIIDVSFATAEKILDGDKDKSRIYVAEADSDLCGILIANMTKVTPKNEKTYSSREKQYDNETELDWLVTWEPNSTQKYNGLGKIIVGEYYKSLEKYGFKYVFVQSEIPERSYAQEFYSRMGFKPSIRGRSTINKIEVNKDIVKVDTGMDNDEVVPMLIDIYDVNQVTKEISEQYKREKLSNESVNLFDIVV